MFLRGVQWTTPENLILNTLMKFYYKLAPNDNYEIMQSNCVLFRLQHIDLFDSSYDVIKLATQLITQA